MRQENKQTMTREQRTQIRNRKQIMAAGVFYGYPTCCIDHFITRYEKIKTAATFEEGIKECNNLTDNQEKFTGTGFIPCPSCADRLVKENADPSTLIKNRACVTAFPDDGQ
jgi:hypothetical protein